jgi:hypothetical protein
MKTTMVLERRPILAAQAPAGKAAPHATATFREWSLSRRAEQRLAEAGFTNKAPDLVLRDLARFDLRNTYGAHGAMAADIKLEVLLALGPRTKRN